MSFMLFCRVLLLFLVLFLISCQEQQIAYNLKQPISDTPTTSGAYIFQEVKIEEKHEITDYSSYYHDFKILQVYGVDKERIMGIIHTINPRYFEGLSIVVVMHSKRYDMNSDEKGRYYPDAKKIEIYEYGESDNYIKANLLHELKHHYCWRTQQYTGHEGCFLKTPIDEEYGIIN